MRRTVLMVLALAVFGGCGDGGSDGPASTSSPSDPQLAEAAASMTSVLEDVSARVDRIRADCTAAVGETATEAQVAACDAGYMTDIFDLADVLVVAGHGLDADLHGATLPPTVRKTPDLIADIARTRDEACACPDETTGVCPVTRADVLVGIDTLLVLLPSWQALS